MLKKLPWLDRAGIIIGLIAVAFVTFLWVTGFAALKGLLAAIAVTAVFAFIVVWAANKRDDNPDNDTAAAVAADLKGEALTTWERIRVSVTGKADAK